MRQDRTASLGEPESPPLDVHAPIVLAIGDLPPRALRVTKVRGRERLSRPYAWEVTFACDEPGVRAAALLHQEARLTLAAGSESPRDVPGVVARVRAMASDEPGSQVFRARVVPRLWGLSLGRTSRVFQDRTVPEIVTAVLDARGIPHRWETSAGYPRRSYVVQYEESDLAFVRRLLAEVGVFYRFDVAEGGPDAGREVVVLSDSAAAPELEGGGRLIFRPASGSALLAGDHAITRFVTSAQAAPSALEVRSYDFRRPGTTLRARSRASDGHRAAVCEHHDRDEHVQEAETELAGAALEQLRRQARGAEGRSHCPRLAPGRAFTLDEHEDAGGTYTVTAVHHEARVRAASGGSGAPAYDNRFTCVPEGGVPRPARPARKVRQVTESAVVVGPEGSEIHADPHGRVLVRFHWQDPAHSSSWVRVVQAWSGAGWGAQLLPRVGMEVLVAFLGGDLGRPVVVGCLPNATHPLPFPVPASAATSGIRTHSTPRGEGHNELSFTDTSGAERVHLRSERDLAIEARHDAATVIGHDQREVVEGDRSTVIGHVDALDVGERLAITVAGSSFADLSRDAVTHATSGGACSALSGRDACIAAKGDVSLSAGGSISLSAGGDVRIKAGGIVTIEAAGVVMVKGATVTGEASGAMTLKGASIDLNP